ncbi:MAG: Flp pilus assembly complex ATPase component TadA [Phycisphaeraceae bacterium]|nr:Flp pilus assembly complex ATPase component TadA [Phycisphaeraceae bacterium]
MPSDPVLAKLRLRPVHGRGKPTDLVGEQVTIGRHPDNTICLHDEKVSRFHCVIEPMPNDSFLARDLDSRNGIRINGVKVPQGLIRAGDVLRVGRSEFLVEAPGAPAPGDHATPVAGEPEWSREFRRILKELPPTDAPLEDISIIDADGQSSSVLQSAGPGPRAMLLLLRLTSKARATDIHVEPKGDAYHVRLRVDGLMVWLGELPRNVGDLVLGLIRAACQLKSAARDAVQDGHFSAKYPDRRVEYRVSLTPSVHGPKGVIRVLDKRDIPHALEELGLLPYMHERIRRVTRQDHGLLLACGPTGSGKTTTLHNALREIDRQSRNVVTIEDPVEYTLEGVTQLPVDEDKGKGFSELLRSVLRQDPDVIMVGEIRDEQTARTAMQASMTGHVVLSTVHAKDTITAVFRLLDLKVEPYLVANSLDLILAQRLVRSLCEHCKREAPLAPGQITRMGKHLGGKTSAFVGVGCKRCLGTGFRGRRAIFELLEVNDELRDIILAEPSVQAMKKVIESGLFTTLAQFGWRLVADGVTSVDEVDRVAGMG